MASKEEISQELNEALGTDIEWDRLLKDDLGHLHSLVESGALAEPIIKNMVKEMGRKQVEQRVDGWYPGKYAGGLL